MGLTRREMLAGLGASAIGGLGMLSAEQAYAEAQRTSPLPFYGGFASGVRPDLSAPSAPAGSVVWSGRTDPPRVALTFDDGPMPNWTPMVLATLARHDVPATFFLKGINVLRHGAIHHRSMGLHELGNHTWDHPDLARLGYRECSDQLARTSTIIERVYGARPTLFRPPYGHLAGSSFLAAAEQDLTTVLWNTQFRERSVADKPAAVVASVREATRPGSIILGHDTGSSNRLATIQNLDAIITALRTDGFAFTTVSELCGLR